MKKTNIKLNHAHTCRECLHARLMRTSPHNPVLAQCKAQEDQFYPMFSTSPCVVHVASEPACSSFLLSPIQRSPELVDKVI